MKKLLLNNNYNILLFIHDFCGNSIDKYAPIINKIKIKSK